MTVLLTGGAGFLGAHVGRELIARGERVVVLDDLSGGVRENVPDSALFVHGDVCDAALVRSLFETHHFDAVFHLAAYAAEGLSHFIRRFNYTNNVVGAVTLINEAIRHRTRRFVFTSSIAVYGAGELPLRESATPHPEDPYGIAKLAVEQDLASAHRQFGLEYTILRPHNLYGPFQSLRDRYRNVVSIFMNQAMQNEPLTIFGDGGQTRAFTYVGDVAAAMAASAWQERARNATFNVGSNHVYAIRQLAEAVLRATGAHIDVRHLPARNEVVHAYADHSRFVEVFGASRETPLDDGILATWQWAKTVGPTATPTFTALEVDRDLPAIWLAR